MPTMVYKYGLKPPIKNTDLVSQQIWKAHRYYNKLIEIERNQRNKVRTILSSHSDVVPMETKLFHQTERLNSLVEEIKQQRQQARSRISKPGQRQAVKEAKDIVRKTRKIIKEEKIRIKQDPIIAQKIKNVNEGAKTDIKAARATCECYWGTYLLIENAIEAARKSKIDPRFHRWDRMGNVGVQIQKGMSVEKLMGGEDKRLQIGKVPIEAWRCRRSPLQRTIVSLRIGSTGTRNEHPVWATWPMIMHRPLPDNAIIKWAMVKKEKLGEKFRWVLHLTIDVPDESKTSVSGIVAMDIGWRKVEHGIRVAFLQSESNGSQEIILDEAIIKAFQKVQDISSVRDKNMNVMRKALMGWIEGKNFPSWFAEKIKYMRLFKSQKRFHSLGYEWRNNRWGGDEDGWNIFEAWRKRDKHLWLWEVNLRDQVYGRRRDYYRNVVAGLTKHYDVIILEDFNLSAMQRNVPIESTEIQASAAKWQQRAACCSELRRYITEVFNRHGRKVIKVNPSMTTRTCHLCGYCHKWNNEGEQIHTCENCGSTWDRDKNAAMNMLRMSRERLGDDEKIEMKKQAKWAKRGRHKTGGRKEMGKYAE